MPTKKNWAELSHDDQVKVLASAPVDSLLDDYFFEGKNDQAFKSFLARERDLWEAQNVKQFKTAGSPPTKDVVLGAWRDLDRSEALLELIDNSIDVWLVRRATNPRKAAKELNIFIDIDQDTGQLTYEDNAGGVPEEKLPNLVVPGFSDTTDFSHTIGSYKTGGKKAVFRLGSAARVTTRYWNPAETSDEAFSIHLDAAWLNNTTEYTFPYAPLRDKSVIEKGQTRYVMQLRDEPVGQPWYRNPEEFTKISNEISRIYALLLIRNPAIKIFLADRSNPLEPRKDLYLFSGQNRKGVDIRPQQVVFNTHLPYQGKDYPISIEIILGCRTTTAVNHDSGIDLYGNDRLFVSADQETFSPWLPSGASRNLVRGLINVRGPNIFIPWDTHKRHLNVDRDLTTLLKTHPSIKQLFENWRETYLAISRQRVTQLIGVGIKDPVDLKAKDLNIPHRAEVKLDVPPKRGEKLPSSVFVPKIKATQKKRTDAVNVNLTFTTSQARDVSSLLSIKRDDISSKAAANELGKAIKEDLLGRATGKRRGRSGKRGRR